MARRQRHAVLAQETDGGAPAASLAAPALTRPEPTVLPPIDPDAARLIPRSMAVGLRAVPVARHGMTLTVAMADPDDRTARQQIAARTGYSVAPVPISERDLADLLDLLYVQPFPPTLAAMLLDAEAVTPESLEAARRSQVTSGKRLGEILVQQGGITPLRLARVTAERLALPLINVLDAPLDPEVVQLLDEHTARLARAVPVCRYGERVLVAFVDPLDGEARRLVCDQLGMPFDLAVTAPNDVRWTLQRVYRDRHVVLSTVDLRQRRPHDSAGETFSTGQLVALFLLLQVALLGALLVPILTLQLLNGFVTGLYVIMSLYRLTLMQRGARHALRARAPDAADAPDATLPIVTVLVPLFRETAVLPGLIQALAALDYPTDKLDVQLLFEETDAETLASAKALRPPAHVQFVVVPDSWPRTKPKACNYGLLLAAGEFCVIFDAEDAPEPDQIRKAVRLFRQSGPELACVQARLNYYNRDQNMLTRWFTTEYSMWFDLTLPGLDASRAPIPLGGTSNYFRTAILRELGAWDPFNVTEDADLGIRLYKAGYHTAVLDSTTYEEANSDVPNWVRQRSRWVKGYMQTWLVHTRHPLKLYRALGPKAFFSFHMTVGGTPFTFLMNPIYWTLTALWFLTKWDAVPLIFPPSIYYLGMAALLLGNFVFTYVNVGGCLMRGYNGLVRYALLSPLYWALMSVAAWRGCYQLVVKPFHWEKTTHGLHLAHAATRSAPTPINAEAEAA